MVGMMLNKSILVKIRNVILPFLIIHAPVVASAGNWNSGGSSFQVETQTLVCEFQKYENSGYEISIAKSWIPENQTHIFNGMGASYPDRNDWGTARITTNSGSKLAWEYKLVSEDKKGSKSETRFKYIFFKTNNKVTASVDFVGYRGINNVWGTCKVEASNVTAPSKPSSDQAPSPSKLNKAKSTCTELGFTAGTEKHGECVLKLVEKKDEVASTIDTSRWLNIRESGSSDLYVDEKGQYIKIKSSSKWYNQLHDRYKKEPNTDIRIGFYYSNNKSDKPKKYEFETIQPSEIQATTEENAKVFIFKTAAVDKLRSLKSKYIYFMVTDYEQGMWFWTRTTKSN